MCFYLLMEFYTEFYFAPDYEFTHRRTQTLCDQFSILVCPLTSHTCHHFRLRITRPWWTNSTKNACS